MIRLMQVKTTTMKQILKVLILITTLGCQAQINEKFNFGFEIQNNKNDLSDGWFKWGKYDLSIDNEAHSGKNSGKITSTKNGGFGSIAYKIPANYTGKTITLEGYMKIKNVTNGFAGLLLRIDGNGRTIAFDNMESQNITGTKDWQKYSITLFYLEEVENIYVAGILSGKGEVWFDDFTLTIGGEDIRTLKGIEKEFSKARLDKEFDDMDSLVDLSNLTIENIESLELLGRVWGFLKYYHPEIAKGGYNWDYELFRFLPRYIETKNKNDRNELIINWISSLGELEKCIKCKPIDQKAVLKPDLIWIYNEEKELKNKLLTVYNNRSQGKNYYIEMTEGVGNPIFKNENSYATTSYPDDGFRLLALYRYWNMINYFFPNKHLTDKDWNTTLKEYIPFFLNSKNELEYELSVIQLIGDVKDTHANLWGGADKIDVWKGEYYAPVHVRFIENKLVVTDYYNEELKNSIGLKIGDVITKINDITVERLITEKKKYFPASNTPTRLRDISADLLRSNSKEIKIEVISDDSKTQTRTLKLYSKGHLNIYKWYRRNNDKSYKMLVNNIGYVTLASIKEEDIPIIKNEFKDTKGIIIDIRNYPSTFVPFSLGSYFVSSSTPFVKFTTGSVDIPGQFTFTGNKEIPSLGKTYKGKLVVLLNELSQSQAEYTAMAFRAGDNTTIIGSTTAGADGNMSKIELPGGLTTVISGIGVYYPNGERTQRIGIIPDIEVLPTIEGIRLGKDELLEKAIEIITKE